MKSDNLLHKRGFVKTHSLHTVCKISRNIIPFNWDVEWQKFESICQTLLAISEQIHLVLVIGWYEEKQRKRINLYKLDLAVSLGLFMYSYFLGNRVGNGVIQGAQSSFNLEIF